MQKFRESNENGNNPLDDSLYDDIISVNSDRHINKNKKERKANRKKALIKIYIGAFIILSFSICFFLYIFNLKKNNLTFQGKISELTASNHLLHQQIEELTQYKAYANDKLSSIQQNNLDAAKISNAYQEKLQESQQTITDLNRKLAQLSNKDNEFSTKYTNVQQRAEQTINELIAYNSKLIQMHFDTLYKELSSNKFGYNLKELLFVLK